MKGSKISLMENEWLVCNTLSIVFVSLSIAQKTHQFSFGDEKRREGINHVTEIHLFFDVTRGKNCQLEPFQKSQKEG